MELTSFGIHSEFSLFISSDDIVHDFRVDTRVFTRSKHLHHAGANGGVLPDRGAVNGVLELRWVVININQSHQQISSGC